MFRCHINVEFASGGAESSEGSEEPPTGDSEGKYVSYVGRMVYVADGQPLSSTITFLPTVAYFLLLGYLKRLRVHVRGFIFIRILFIC
jgi:hypothetical protein